MAEQLFSTFNILPNTSPHTIIGDVSLKQVIKRCIASAVLNAKDIVVYCDPNAYDQLMDLNDLPVLSSDLSITQENKSYGEVNAALLIEVAEQNRQINKVKAFHTSPCLGRWTAYDITIIINEIGKNINPYPFLPKNYGFEYTADQFYDLQQLVQQYRKHIHILNDLDDLHVFKLYYNIDHILRFESETLKTKVNQWNEALIDIKLALNKAISDYAASQFKKEKENYQQQIDDLTSSLSRLQAFILKYGDGDISKSKMLSNSLVKQKFKEWESLNLEDYSPLQSKSKLSKNLHELETTLNLPIKSLESTKHLNFLNLSNDGTQSAHDQLLQTIDDINKYDILLKPLNIHDKTLLHTISQINDTIERLRPLHKINKYQQYGQWLETAQKTSEVFLSFLGQLQHLPQDEWTQQFEYFYLQSCIRHNGFHEEDVQNYKVDWKYSHAKYEEVVSNCISQRVAQYSELLKDKSFNKKLSLDAIDNANVFSQHGIKGHVVLRKLTDVDLASVQTSDVIINDVLLEDVNCIQYISVEEPLSNLKTLPFIYNGEKPMTKVSALHQLRYTKLLANSLSDIKGMAVGYQLKNCNIISLLKDHWTRHLDDLMDTKNAKAFDLSNSEDYTDFLLALDRPIKFLINDGMINWEYPNVMDQLTLLSTLEKFGFEVINLGSHDLISEDLEVLLFGREIIDTKIEEPKIDEVINE